jgi:hypothetical protein
MLLQVCIDVNSFTFFKNFIGSNSSSALPCKFYLMGHCDSGKYCRFAHIKPHEAPKLVCSYYLKGTCKFGKRCLLSHELASSRPSSSIPKNDEIPKQGSQSVSEEKQYGSKYLKSQELQPSTTETIQASEGSPSDDYDRLLFGDDEDADDILNMIGEELKNHCSFSHKPAKLPEAVAVNCPSDDVDSGQNMPPKNTDYSRLARMYASSPTLLIPSKTTVLADEPVNHEPVHNSHLL